MTIGAIENFWARFDIIIKNRGYDSLKDFIEDINIGISYSTLLTKRSRKILPEVESLVKIAEELDVSVDYLLFGYVSETRRITGEEIQLLRKYQTASPVEKNAIKVILQLK